MFLHGGCLRFRLKWSPDSLTFTWVVCLWPSWTIYLSFMPLYSLLSIALCSLCLLLSTLYSPLCTLHSLHDLSLSLYFSLCLRSLGFPWPKHLCNAKFSAQVLLERRFFILDCGTPTSIEVLQRENCTGSSPSSIVAASVCGVACHIPLARTRLRRIMLSKQKLRKSDCHSCRHDGNKKSLTFGGRM